jgi:hypothetical protein
VTDYRCCRPKCTRRCGENFAMGFQTPPDRRAVMTVTTDGYETIFFEVLVIFAVTSVTFRQIEKACDL